MTAEVLPEIPQSLLSPEHTLQWAHICRSQILQILPGLSPTPLVMTSLSTITIPKLNHSRYEGGVAGDENATKIMSVYKIGIMYCSGQKVDLP